MGWLSIRHTVGLALGIMGLMAHGACSQQAGNVLDLSPDAGSDATASSADVALPDPDLPPAEPPVDYPDDVLASVLMDVEVDETDANHLGDLLSVLSLFVEEAGSSHRRTPNEEGVVSAWAWPGLVDPARDASQVGLDFLEGVEVGDGEFEVDPSCLGKGAEPRFSLRDGRISDDEIRLGPGPVPLLLAVGPARLRLVLSAAVVTGTVALDGVGVAVSGGWVLGTAPVAAVRAAFNAFIGSEVCSCLGAAAQVYQGGDACGPVPNTESCVLPREQACAVLATSCPVIGSLVRSEADVDLDSDGIPDGLSASVRVEARGVRLRAMTD